MTCDELEPLMEAYLDSEIDARTAAEVGAHLESCAACAAAFKAAQRANERIAAVLSAGERSEDLWHDVEARLRPAHVVFRFFGAWPLAAAAALMLFAGGVFWMKAQPLDLAKAAGQCHSAYLQRLAAPEFTGAVPQEVEEEFRGKLDAAAFTYHPETPVFSTRGSRFCHIANVPCALVMGDVGKVPVSVIVFAKGNLAQFPGARERLDSGDPVVCSRTGRYHFAARVVGNYVVCTIAEAPQSIVEDLVKSVPDAA